MDLVIAFAGQRGGRGGAACVAVARGRESDIPNRPRADDPRGKRPIAIAPLVEPLPTSGRNIYRLASAELNGQPAAREIVGSTYDDRVCAFDAGGTHLWDATVGGFVFDLAAGDLDGDGTDEILAAPYPRRPVPSGRRPESVMPHADLIGFVALAWSPSCFLPQATSLFAAVTSSIAALRPVATANSGPDCAELLPVPPRIPTEPLRQTKQ